MSSSSENEPDPATRHPDRTHEALHRNRPAAATPDAGRPPDERARAARIATREAALDAALAMTFPASDPPWMP